MAAPLTVQVDITINVGALFQLGFTWTRADGTIQPLTIANGGTRDLQARMQARKKKVRPGDVVVAEDLYLDLTSGAGGGLLVEQMPEGGVDVGTTWIDLGADVTGVISAKAGFWDLELFDPADARYVVRLAEGKVTFDPGTTI